MRLHFSIVVAQLRKEDTLQIYYIYFIIILMACNTFQQVLTYEHTHNSNNNKNNNNNNYNKNNNNQKDMETAEFINEAFELTTIATNPNPIQIPAATTTTTTTDTDFIKDYLTKVSATQITNGMLLPALSSSLLSSQSTRSNDETIATSSVTLSLLPVLRNFILSQNSNTNDSNEIDNMDYVMTKHIASHHHDKHNKNFNSTATTTTNTNTKSYNIMQDLSSLSLLSLNETTAIALNQQHREQRRNVKGGNGTIVADNSINSIKGSNSRSSSSSSSSGATHATYQQIGLQHIAVGHNNVVGGSSSSNTNAAGTKTAGKTNFRTTAATALANNNSNSNSSNSISGSSSNTHSGVSGNGSGSESGVAKSTLRTAATAAKKIETKYILPKPQKTDAPMLNYIFDTFSTNKHHHHDQRYGPHFEDVQRVGQPTNMTIQAGSSIHLNCRISLLQDKTVSWVRRNAMGENALDLLTVGLHTYTGDKRYKMEFQYPNNWRLKITNVKKDDEAMYECQISTHPPRVIQINLHVNAPKVMIVDEFGDPLQEKYYEIDSTLQLSCVVRNVAMTSSVVYWKHGEDVLNYDVTRGGVNVKTELMEDGANSTLSIAKINKSDSGNYTCSISDFQNFSIVVHILNGESFAELHHGGARSTFYPTLLVNLILFLVILCLPAYIHR